MKILTINNFHPKDNLGGASLLCLDILRRLSKRGHEISFLVSGTGTSGFKDDVSNILNLSYLKISPHPHKAPNRWSFLDKLEWIQRGRGNLKIAAEQLEEIKPDICYVHNLELLTDSPLAAIYEANLPTVFHLHNYWLLGYIKLLKEGGGLIAEKVRSFYLGYRRGLPQRSYFIAISEFVKKIYVEAGVSPQKIVVVYNGLPDGWFQNLPPMPSEKKLLFVGALSPHKGVHVAIEAMAVLRKSDFENACLDIVGPRGKVSYWQELQNLVAKYNLSTQVRFLGERSREELFDLYPNYKCCFVPSVWQEPFGLTVIEAMARGVPVVASSAGGIPEIIEDSKTGFLVPPDNPQALADACGRVLVDEQLSQKIRKQAYEMVRERFNLSNLFDEVENVLRRVAL